MISQIKEHIKNLDPKDVLTFIDEVKQLLHEESPLSTQPVDYVRWVDIKKVKANDYNPNRVAKTEMKLLHTSIDHDGYTQPVVTIYDKKKDEYVIVDGFHRYFVCKTYKDINDRNNGLLPVVVINKDINDRMASTVRHNRARGKHAVDGMSTIVFKMLKNGWADADICNELGMEAEELVKLKHITGFSKLFSDIEYKPSWESTRQIKVRKNYVQAD